MRVEALTVEQIAGLAGWVRGVEAGGVVGRPRDGAIDSRPWRT
jgi:hypothetical protein